MDNIDYNAQIKPYLKQDESVLWKEKPKKRLIYLPSDLFSILMGVLWLLIAGFWFTFSLINLQESYDTMNVLYIILSAPFALAGIWLIVGKNLMLANQRKYILYAITNKRALIINTKKDFCEEFKYSDIGSLKVKKYNDGTGSIFFYKDKNEQTKNKLSTSGIFGISEVDEALKILQNRVRKSK